MSTDYYNSNVNIDWGLSTAAIPSDLITCGISVVPNYPLATSIDNLDNLDSCLKIGNTTITAEDVCDIKTLLDTINELPDNNEFKQLFDLKKMINKLSK